MDSNCVCVEAFHIYSSALHIPTSTDTHIKIDTTWYRIVCVLWFHSDLIYIMKVKI